MSMEDLRENIRRYCEENRIFGAVRLTVKGEILLDEKYGYEDLFANIPLSEKSLFTFYSLTKPFCALGLMKLRDKGLVDLEAHPSAYVPEAKGFDERVKMRQLLTHTSGLPDFEQNPEFKAKHAPGYYEHLKAHLEYLKEYPQYFEPGTAGKYTNINFILCALTIENVSGMSYEEYMHREVFEPLGMKTAVIDSESKTVEHRVKGYELSEQGELCEAKKAYNWVFGAGDILGTPDDVYCLNRAIKERLLISEDSWREVLTPSPLNSMGMGCTLSVWHEKKRITHNGGHSGYRTLHIQLPEDDFDLIILSNSGFGNVRGDVPEMAYEAYYGDGAPKGTDIEMDKGYVKR